MNESRPAIDFLAFRGPDARPWLDDLARLRMAVFRDWPYLYDGEPRYEKEYFETYFKSPEALIVIVRAADETVGATTALPLKEAEPEFRAPFDGNPDAPSVYKVYYLGESVLLPPYRGRGIGHRFFDFREERARELGYRYAAFCAVDRPNGHPQRPAGYCPLDPFWRKRGYVRQPALRAHFNWKDTDQPEETQKSLTFWTRPLTWSG